MGSLGPFSWLLYFIHYHHRSTRSRRIQEKWKGGKGESERAREKEIKRRRERGTGAVDSSKRQGRIIAPRTCLCLRWISHKWINQHTCTRVFSLSWPDAKNVSITIPAPSWNTGLEALVWSLYLLQWHGVEISLKDIP